MASCVSSCSHRAMSSSTLVTMRFCSRAASRGMPRVMCEYKTCPRFLTHKTLFSRRIQNEGCPIDRGMVGFAHISFPLFLFVYCPTLFVTSFVLLQTVHCPFCLLNSFVVFSAAVAFLAMCLFSPDPNWSFLPRQSSQIGFLNVWRNCAIFSSTFICIPSGNRKLAHQPSKAHILSNGIMGDKNIFPGFSTVAERMGRGTGAPGDRCFFFG